MTTDPTFTMNASSRRGSKDREWICEAVAKIEADFNRSSDTHLIKLDLPGLTGIDLYMKDESTHPSGSLKHRLARSLVLYGLCKRMDRQGHAHHQVFIGKHRDVGSLFRAPAGSALYRGRSHGHGQGKDRADRIFGGKIKKVEPGEIYGEAAWLARQLGGHYANQFTYAERATDWRGNNSIAESIFTQMAKERHLPPWHRTGAAQDFRP